MHTRPEGSLYEPVGVTSGGCFIRPHMFVAYTCSHYRPTNLVAWGAGLWSMCGPPPCYQWELFIHLHSVAVDHISWPAGDSLLLERRPVALKVQGAVEGWGGKRGDEKCSSSPVFIFPSLLCISYYSPIYLSCTFTLSLCSAVFSPYFFLLLLSATFSLPPSTSAVVSCNTHCFLYSLGTHSLGSKLNIFKI